MLGRLSVRGRLIIVVGTILMVGFLTTNLISFRVSSEALKTTILQNELPLTSSNIYSELQADLLKPLFVSSLMSNDTFVKDWLLAGEKDVATIQRYLAELQERYGVFTSFVVSEQTNRYYHFQGLAQVVDERDPEDFWFFRVRNMRDPYEINIDFNQAQDNAITIFVNYKMFDYNGDFLAAVGVGLKLDTVSEIVSRYSDNYQRSIYFIDRHGRVTVRSKDALISENSIFEAPGMSTIADKVLVQDIGYFEYERDGETMLLTTRQIPEFGWTVIVEQREADALRNLWRGFMTNLVIGLLIIVITIATVSYAVNLYQKRLETMATTDKLTGIGNRQVFDFSLEKAVRQKRRSGRAMSVVLFDIDHFKLVNDTLGHLRGDVVIQRVAAVAQSALRGSDLLCRWGGEELIVLAQDCQLADALVMAEKLRTAIAEAPLFQPDDGRRVTISLGVAELRADDDVDTVIARADAALYAAKNRGRNQVVSEQDGEQRPEFGLVDA